MNARAAAAGCVGALLIAGAAPPAGRAVELAGTGGAAARPAGPTVPAPAAGSGPTSPPAGRLHVLMINGGGDADDNFRSHVRHLEELSQRLIAAGVPRERISVLASDGEDPAADVAIRQADPEGFWLLTGTPVERWLAEPVAHESTRLPGLRLQAATRLNVSRWFASARERLAPGDTLLLYVTDHGHDNPRDPLENSITLWGERESLSVRGLRAELERLPSNVRVVTIMSQCFSGAFAALAEPEERSRRRSGAVCGTFASTADRPAFGCYPEAAREDRVGHSFALFDALAGTLRLDDAHAETLVRDQSPDVPLTTSDAFLAERLRLASVAARQRERPFGERWLGEARKTEAARRQLQLADRVAAAFGMPAPRSFAAVERALDEVEDLAATLEQQRKSWDQTLEDMTRANYDRFLASQPRWRARLRPTVLRRLASDERRALTRELLAALDAFTGTHAEDRRRLEALLDRSNGSGNTGHRMDVRQAALLRVRILLAGAAASAWLARHGSAKERKTLEALRACESFALPAAPGRTPPPPAPFPSLSEDRERAESLRPSWLGIGFEPPARRLRARLRLTDGAAAVTEVAPRSPAAAAGVRRGDVVLGEPGKPFTLANELRAWATLAPRGRPLPLELLRQGRRRVVQIVPAAQPAP